MVLVIKDFISKPPGFRRKLERSDAWSRKLVEAVITLPCRGCVTPSRIPIIYYLIEAGAPISTTYRQKSFFSPAPNEPRAKKPENPNFPLQQPWQGTSAQVRVLPIRPRPIVSITGNVFAGPCSFCSLIRVIQPFPFLFRDDEASSAPRRLPSPSSSNPFDDLDEGTRDFIRDLL